MARRSRFWFVPNACRVGLILTGLSLFLASFGLMETLHLPLTHFHIDAGSVGLVLAATGALLFFASPKWAVATTWTIFLAAIVFLADFRAPRFGDQMLFGTEKVWYSAEEWIENATKPDPVLGHRNPPGKMARQRHRDFEAVYAIGGDGWRVVPEPADPAAPEIVFIGCSYSYGVGVADDETYTSILAREAWPNYRVRNNSVCGWGTTHAFVRMSQLLEEPNKPAAIIHAAVPGHLRRNADRRTWHQTMKSTFIPFDLGPSGPVAQSLRPWKDATAEEGPELLARERRMTVALLKGMTDRARSAGVPFLVILLNDGERDPERKAMLDALEESGAPFLDFRDAMTDFFPLDGHATPVAHRLLAYAIAGSKPFADALSQADLYRPGAVSLSGVPWNGWRQRYAVEGTRETSRPFGVPGHFEQRGVHPISDGNGPITCLPFLPVEKGGACRARFRVRADQPRSLGVAWRRALAPVIYLAPWKTIEAGPTWRTIDVTFKLPPEPTWGELSFHPMSSLASYEVADLEITLDGGLIAPKLDFFAWRPGALRRLIAEPDPKDAATAPKGKTRD